MKKSLFARWQANFWAGLAIVLPAVISLAVLRWLFGTVANITDTLLIFLPTKLTHHDQGSGPMYWYWSLVALVAGDIPDRHGRLAGPELLRPQDHRMGGLRPAARPVAEQDLRATKQVNDAFSATNKTAFRTVVLVEFPHAGVYSIGFITSDQQEEVQAKTGQKVVCVFVPATPNPTSGFLLMVPEDKVIKLAMSVPDAIKYIISLGAILPEHTPLGRRAGNGPPAEESRLPSAALK